VDEEGVMKNKFYFFLRLAIPIICLIFNSPLSADNLKVSWNANLEADLKGYKVHWGTSTRNYTNHSDIIISTDYNVTDLTPGNIYYFAVTALDTANNESAYSDEVNYTLAVPDTTPPIVLSTEIKSATELEIIFS
jgi:hypothetical protein